MRTPPIGALVVLLTALSGCFTSVGLVIGASHRHDVWREEPAQFVRTANRVLVESDRDAFEIDVTAVGAGSLHGTLRGHWHRTTDDTAPLREPPSLNPGWQRLQDAASVDVDLSHVRSIRVHRRNSNGSAVLTGFLVGLLVDATVVAVIASQVSPY